MTRLRFSAPLSVIAIALLTAACGSSSKETTGTHQGEQDSNDAASVGTSDTNVPAAGSTSGGSGPTAPGATDLLDAAALPTSNGGVVVVGTIAIPDKAGISVGVDDAGTLTVLCGGASCACNDGIDNDGDGTTDGFDAECTGPFDSDEGSFATGIPGDNRDEKWQDCFFDGNSGAGDDGCRYSTDCLTGDLPADAPGCAVADACQDFCAPLAPPGCDCFGCCDVTVEGRLHTVRVATSCSTENIDDPALCPPCVKTTACANDCGECELCLGKTIDDLPEQCFMTTLPPAPPPGDGGGYTDGPDGSTPDGGVTLPPPGQTTPPGETSTPPNTPPNVCDNGGTACTTSADCGFSNYCSLGCCRFVPQIN